MDKITIQITSSSKTCDIIRKQGLFFDTIAKALDIDRDDIVEIEDKPKSKDPKTLQQKTQESFKSFIEGTKDQIKRLNSENDSTIEATREEIQEEPLEIATGKEFDGTKTYMILLGTGGPAMRIIGELNEYNQPETAQYQYQDWFTPWTNAMQSPKDTEILIKYAENFYFGE